MTSDKIVLLSDVHEKYVNTSSARPPRIKVIKAPNGTRVKVACLFPRSVSTDRIKSGCIAYALKELKGYTMAMEDKVELLRRAVDIGRRAELFDEVERLLPLPSSHDLVVRACRVLRARLPNHPPPDSIFRRPTFREVLASLPEISRVPVSLRDEYWSQVERLKGMPPENILVLKTIPVRIRRFFKVVNMMEAHGLRASRHVLLVDDVLSTGVTFSKCYRPPEPPLPSSHH